MKRYVYYNIILQGLKIYLNLIIKYIIRDIYNVRKLAIYRTLFYFIFEKIEHYFIIPIKSTWPNRTTYTVYIDKNHDTLIG